MEVRDQGLYCPQGGFFIDPVVPVERAVITHAHGDHCRPGHRAILATPETGLIAQARYGAEAFGRVEGLPYGMAQAVGGVTVRFAPAGHVLGSAQVVIERAGVRAVVSGDYTRGVNPTCTPFELVPCDLFVTEATFGLPVFDHPSLEGEIAKLLASVAAFPERCHVVGVYALGKAQRILAGLRAAGYDRTVFIHGALERLCDLYEELGVPLGPRAPATTARKDFAGEIVLAPPGALQDRWSRRLGDVLPVGASGWMQVRARARQRRVELPLIISDHCDWEGLTRTITETGARTVWVTHGAEEALCHWCATQGIDAAPLALAGRGEDGDGD
nr:ligase-associated DNA damage response exonuclease [Rubricella aquisinus]